MGRIINVRDMCQHLTTAIKAQKPIIGLSPRRYNIAVAKVLHRSGFITILGLGSRETQPWAQNAETIKEAIERLDLDRRKTDTLTREIYDNMPKAITGNTTPDDGAFGGLKLWVGFSMRKIPGQWKSASEVSVGEENCPPPGKEFIMKSIRAIARGQRQDLPVTMQVPGIKKLTDGFDVVVKDTTMLGLYPHESIVLLSPEGSLEIREAKKRGLGGIMFCKAEGPRDWILLKEAPSEQQLRQKEEARLLSKEVTKTRERELKLKRAIRQGQKTGVEGSRLEQLEQTWKVMAAELKEKKLRKAKFKKAIKSVEKEKLRKFV